MSEPVAGSPALLLAAHGERRLGADNEGVANLAAQLTAQRVAAAIAVGFLKGAPSIGDAVLRLAGRDLVVYPLFLSDGYFTRTVLPRQLAQAGAFDGGRTVHVLPPLGLDPALSDLIVDRARARAQTQEWPPAVAELVLVAHGSSDNGASRLATERMAGQIAAMGVFARVQAAFLEEPPLLPEAIASAHGPAIVVGLFAGEGRHGGDDVPALVARLGRPDVLFAGNVGRFEALSEVIAAAMRRPRETGNLPASSAAAPHFRIYR